MRSLGQVVRQYGMRGSLRLAADWVSTKISMPQARLVRRPFYLRGRRFMQIGAGLTTGPGMRLDALPAEAGDGVVLTIGKDVQLNDYVHIAAASSVTIGDRVLIASKVFITDHNHGRFSGPGPHDSPTVAPAERALSFASVVIEDDVWIGEFVAVLPGVRIGKGAVIGTMSVVTRDVPAYCLAIGSPACVIKRYNFTTSMWESV